MGESTAIAWCDHTFNPWWGCVEAGEECDHCYARAFSNRLGRAKWGKDEPRVPASEKMWRDLERWHAAAERDGVRRRVFVASMADVLENRRDLDSARERLWAVIERTPYLDYLLLTKRPEMFANLTPAAWRSGSWPRNAWAGTTCGLRKNMHRVTSLMRCAPSAPVRFVSAEPLLEAMSFRWAPWDDCFPHPRRKDHSRPTVYRDGRPIAGSINELDGLRMLDWVIVGGESGPGARLCHVNWVRSLRDECREATVACFIKQMGSRPVMQHPMEVGSLILARGSDPKGADPAEWPDDLLVREFPEPRAA